MGNTDDRDGSIIARLSNSWQSFRGSSPDQMTSIIRFVEEIDGLYRQAAFNGIVRHITNSMQLHILSLLATFHDKATEEGISQEDYKETLSQVLPELFHILEEIDTYCSCPELDQLIDWVNITASLQTLSRSDTAEEAQGWLYELPDIYYQQLKERGLLCPKKTPLSK